MLLTDMARTANRPRKEFFGPRFRAWRESRGLSAADISEASGLPPQLISEIELGKRLVSETNVEALAGVEKLGLSLSRMQAWRAADQIGKDSLWLILTEAEDLLDALVAERGAGEGWRTYRFTVAASATPGPLDAARPLNADESAAYQQLAALGAHEGEDVMTVLAEPEGRRIAALQEAVRDAKKRKATRERKGAT